MSLMGTLAKVAIGVIAARRAKHVMSRDPGSVSEGGLFGGSHSPNADKSTGLEGMMSDILSGDKGGSRSQGGLGGMLESLQRENPHTRDGGLDDLLGGGGRTGDALGSLIKNLAGGSAGGASAGGLGGLMSAAGGQKGGSFGDLLNQSMGNRGDPPEATTQEQEAVAGLMLKAMIQAAKSDGRFDADEQAKIVDHLGDVSPEERDIVAQEMRSDVDVKELARQVPPGLERQVYAMSLLGIDLDNRQEAQYLHDLAGELSMDKDAVERVHAKMGTPSIYS